jgi:dTMP kinase
MPKSQGRLIIFDGIDGTGKTTQIGLAQKVIEKTSTEVISIRYLGGTPIGEAIRQVYLSSIERPPQTTVYMAAAIQAALIPHIDHEKSDGKIILLDRGPLSLAAYQIIGDNMDKSFSTYADEGIRLLAPDLIILYDLDPKTALERKQTVKKDYFESKPIEYFDRVRQAYLDVSKLYSNVVLISASGNIENVHEETIKAISKVLAS